MRQWSVAVSLLACVVGCGGSGSTSDPTDTGGLADIGDVADAGSASDASGLADAGDTFDAADTQDAADALDATDTQDAADALDAADTQDAADGLDVADTQDAADTLDAADVTDADVPDDAGPTDPEAPARVKLVNPVGGEIDWFEGASFGRSAAMEGDLYVVGADEDSQRGPSAGAVLIGTRIDGAWVSERVAPDSLEDASRFGASVAISDGVIAVGARNDPRWGERAGQVWILERRFGAWTVTEQVAPPEPEPLGRFGSAVAFDGETLVVSSNSADVEQGKVHIFRRDSDAGFVHVVTHLSGRDSDTSLYGTAIALEGDTLAVGDIESESVWLFSAPFTEDPVRIGSETSSGFGSALDINEDWLLVGASSGPTGGSALAYGRTETGVAETPIEITVDGLDSGARFGAAVALDGDTALIGAFRAAVAADRAGAAYRFALSDAGFEELGVLTPDTLAAGDRFGFAVASAGGDAIVTSIGDDGLADTSGASYRYAFSSGRSSRRSESIAGPSRRTTASAAPSRPLATRSLSASRATTKTPKTQAPSSCSARLRAAIATCSALSVQTRKRGKSSARRSRSMATGSRRARPATRAMAKTQAPSSSGRTSTESGHITRRFGPSEASPVGATGPPSTSTARG